MENMMEYAYENEDIKPETTETATEETAEGRTRKMSFAVTESKNGEIALFSLKDRRKNGEDERMPVWGFQGYEHGWSCGMDLIDDIRDIQGGINLAESLGCSNVFPNAKFAYENIMDEGGRVIADARYVYPDRMGVDGLMAFGLVDMDLLDLALGMGDEPPVKDSLAEKYAKKLNAIGRCGTFSDFLSRPAVTWNRYSKFMELVSKAEKDAGDLLVNQLGN